MNQAKRKAHAERLIKLYVGQLKDAESFMTIVLNQAIHALNNECNPDEIEHKVAKLEDIWQTFP